MTTDVGSRWRVAMGAVGVPDVRTNLLTVRSNPVARRIQRRAVSHVSHYTSVIMSQNSSVLTCHDSAAWRPAALLAEGG